MSTSKGLSQYGKDIKSLQKTLFDLLKTYKAAAASSLSVAMHNTLAVKST